MTEKNKKTAAAKQLFASRMKSTPVHVPELDEGDDQYFVYLAPMSAGQIIRFNEVEVKDRMLAILDIAKESTQDEKGEKLFAEIPEDEMKNIDVRVYRRLAEAITTIMRASYETEDANKGKDPKDGGDSPSS